MSSRAALIGLSPTQRHVVAQMRKGHLLWVSEGLDSRCWLRRPEDPAGTQESRVLIGTFKAMEKRGLLAAERIGYPVSSYRLTPSTLSPTRKEPAHGTSRREGPRPPKGRPLASHPAHLGP